MMRLSLKQRHHSVRQRCQVDEANNDYASDQAARIQNVLAYDTDDETNDGDATKIPLSGVSVVDETIPDKNDDDDNDFLKPPRPANPNTKMKYLITVQQRRCDKDPRSRGVCQLRVQTFQGNSEKGRGGHYWEVGRVC